MQLSDQALERPSDRAIENRAIENRAIERPSDRATEPPSDRANARSTLQNNYLRTVHNSSSDVEKCGVTLFITGMNRVGLGRVLHTTGPGKENQAGYYSKPGRAGPDKQTAPRGPEVSV